MSADERQHSERLVKHIHEALQRAGGWLDFERFMELALYAPGLGYYAAGTHKLGSGGDFTTAPEISPLFSRCVANQCMEVLQNLQQGNVLELGAGSGVMAADMLLHFEAHHALPANYFILDVSADLRARQRQLLQVRVPHLLDRVQWLDTLPTTFNGVIVANEVLDALPVQRFVIVDQEVHASGVAWRDGLISALRPASVELRQAVRAVETARGARFAAGYGSEINLRARPWLQSLAASLQSGALLLLDYGLPQAEYYSAQRHAGTLACFYKHHLHDDALINIGIQDITAWVDFTAVAEAGIEAGLELRGFATQAHFLMDAGLDKLLRDSTALTDTARWQQSQQVQKLILPGGMGESFKVMAFSRECDAAFSGFGFRDLRDRL